MDASTRRRRSRTRGEPVASGASGLRVRRPARWQPNRWLPRGSVIAPTRHARADRSIRVREAVNASAACSRLCSHAASTGLRAEFPEEFGNRLSGSRAKQAAHRLAVRSSPASRIARAIEPFSFNSYAMNPKIPGTHRRPAAVPVETAKAPATDGEEEHLKDTVTTEASPGSRV